MEIDARTTSQLIKMQLMNDIDLQGTAVQTASNAGDSLFDLLLKELMASEGRGEQVSDVSVPYSGELLTNALQEALFNAATQGDSAATGNGAVSELSSLIDKAYITNTDSVTKMGDFEELIVQASNKYGVPQSLIKAVIETESSFNANAVSSAGAKGLMQLMDGTARGLGVTDPFDPVQNIDGGTRYLSYQLKRFGGELRTALAAYNAGPGRVQQLGISNDEQLMEKFHLLPKETQNYIAKIERARIKYES